MIKLRFILTSVISLIFFSNNFIVTRNPLFLFFILIGIMSATLILFFSYYNNKEYINLKKIYMLSIPVLILLGLILFYTYQFKSIYLNESIYVFLFYFELLSLIVFICSFIYILKKYDNLNII
jgi:hypothetical protein